MFGGLVRPKSRVDSLTGPNPLDPLPIGPHLSEVESRPRTTLRRRDSLRQLWSRDRQLPIRFARSTKREVMPFILKGTARGNFLGLSPLSPTIIRGT